VRPGQEGPAESPQEGGAPLPDMLHSLGYPRCRKNGGHSEAGAQPCRFIARRATNGAPSPRRRSRRVTKVLRAPIL